MGLLSTVPPAPEVTYYLVNEYHNQWKKLGLTFGQFLKISGYANPAHNLQGMDDDARWVVEDNDTLRLTIPRKPITGDLHVVVLLVDFPDLVGRLPKEHYETLLFSRQTYLTESLADYYDEVSRRQVNVQGEVHGWLQMPHKYTYYTNGNSGLPDKHLRQHYPRDARKLAEDAVDVALANGVKFLPKLDALDDGTVTALFIVHAGRGAEKLHPLLRGDQIWSHKWHMVQPRWVATNLWASSYLMGPQEAQLGIWAHELGHLAFQWQDVYDPNYNDEGNQWNGNGIWDLMASGSYAGGELRPVHPAGVHKLQHGWIEVEELQSSQLNVTLKPVTHLDGKVLKLRSRHYRTGQYLLLEYRSREAFDRALPGEGLLVWRIDESGGQERDKHPGMHLIQANGPHDLLAPDDRNTGDPGDPFPGATMVRELTDTGAVSTSFPGGPPSGIRLKNITHSAASQEVRLDIEFASD